MISIQSTHLVSAHKPSRVITELSQEMNFPSLQRLCYVKCKNINKTLPDLILYLRFCQGLLGKPGKMSHGNTKTACLEVHMHLPSPENIIAICSDEFWRVSNSALKSSDFYLHHH